MSAAFLKKNTGEMALLEMHLNADSQRPFIKAAGRNYETLADLVAAYPELGAANQLPLYCELCTHLHGGAGYILITAPDKFRDRYQALIQHASMTDSDIPSVADFGPFDVAGISAPYLEKDIVVFYAEDSLYGVPYRVEASWPANAKIPVKFLLLPLQE